MDSICYIIVLALTLALMIYGFWLCLKKKCPGENGMDGVERQLRGFAFIGLGWFVLVVGAAACFSKGSGPGMISKLIGRMEF